MAKRTKKLKIVKIMYLRQDGYIGNRWGLIKESDDDVYRIDSFILDSHKEKSKAIKKRINFDMCGREAVKFGFPNENFKEKKVRITIQEI